MTGSGFGGEEGLPSGVAEGGFGAEEALPTDVPIANADANGHGSDHRGASRNDGPALSEHGFTAQFDSVLQVPLTANELGLAREAACRAGKTIEQWAHGVLAPAVRASH
jgi:hypothetical protein